MFSYRNKDLFGKIILSVDNYQSYTKIKEKYYSEHVECSEESEDENDYSEDTIVND